MNHHPHLRTASSNGSAIADLAPCASASPLSSNGNTASVEPICIKREPLSRADLRELIRLKIVSDLCRFS